MIKAFLYLVNLKPRAVHLSLFVSFIKSEKIYIRKNVPGQFTHILTESKDPAVSTKKTFTQKENKNRPEIVQPDFRKNAESNFIDTIHDQPPLS
jgi:hypothetical protein